jgi:uncharacterized protein (TIGR02453 family)
MGFSGFGEQAVDFYDGLLADNSKVYWQAHKHVYDSDVRAPMEALLTELESEFGAGKVFRPHRDTRFARDKSPYKDHCGGVVETGRGAGAYYVEVGPAGLRAGGGSYAMAPDQLSRFRTAVAEDLHGQALKRILADLEAQGWTRHGDTLKTSPRDYPADHPHIDLLRHRTLFVVRIWPPDDTLHTPACLSLVRESWRRLRPFNDWCATHIGPSDRPWR